MVEQKYIDYWRAKQAKEDEQSKVWAQEAWQVAKKVADQLRREFGAAEIVVFGSLVKGLFWEDSDIDIAASGIANADFFSALAAVNTHSRWPIDLKPMESLEPRFKERVLSTGKVLSAGEDCDEVL